MVSVAKDELSVAVVVDAVVQLSVAVIDPRNTV